MLWSTDVFKGTETVSVLSKTAAGAVAVESFPLFSLRAKHRKERLPKSLHPRRDLLSNQAIFHRCIWRPVLRWQCR